MNNAIDRVKALRDAADEFARQLAEDLQPAEAEPRRNPYADWASSDGYTARPYTYLEMIKARFEAWNQGAQVTDVALRHSRRKSRTMSELLPVDNPMPLPDFLYAAMDCEERGEHGLLHAPTYSSTFTAKAMRHVAWALRVADIVRRMAEQDAPFICATILQLANEAGERDE